MKNSNKKLILRIAAISLISLLCGVFGVGLVKLKAACVPSNVSNVISVNCPVLTNTAILSTDFNEANSGNNSATVLDRICAINDISVTPGIGTTTAVEGTDVKYFVNFERIIDNSGSYSGDRNKLYTFNFSLNYPQNFLTDFRVDYKNTYQSYGGNGGNIVVDSTNTVSGLTTVNGRVNYPSTTGGGNNSDYQFVLEGKTTSNALPTNTLNFAVTSTPAVGCTNTDPNTNNNFTSFSTTITPNSDLSVVKTTSNGSNNFLSTKAEINTPVAHTLTVTNNGPSTATAPLVLTDAFNSNTLDFVSAIPPIGWTCGLPTTVDAIYQHYNTIPEGTPKTSNERLRQDTFFSDTNSKIECIALNPIANGDIAQFTINYIVRNKY